MRVTQGAGWDTEQRRVYGGSYTPREEARVSLSESPLCSLPEHTTIFLSAPL